MKTFTATFTRDGNTVATAAASFEICGTFAPLSFSGEFATLAGDPPETVWSVTFENYCRSIAAASAVEVHFSQEGEWIAFNE
jgi:hypothetical protein